MRILNEEEKELLYEILRSKHLERHKVILIGHLINKVETAEEIRQKMSELKPNSHKWKTM